MHAERIGYVIVQNFQIPFCTLQHAEMAEIAAAAQNGASEPAWEGGQILFSGGTDWAQVQSSDQLAS